MIWYFVTMIWYLRFCTFLLANKFWHHQNVTFHTRIFSTVHFFFSNSCILRHPQVLWKAFVDVFIILCICMSRQHILTTYWVQQSATTAPQATASQCFFPLPVYPVANYPSAGTALCAVGKKYPGASRTFYFQMVKERAQAS